jgi:hydrogenase-4 component E
MAAAGFFVFLGAAGLLWARNMVHSLGFLALEGLALTLLVATMEPMTLAIIAMMAATLAVKGALIPGTMHRVVSQWPNEYRQDVPLPFWTYPVAAGLLLAVGHVIALIAPTGLILHPALFFYGLASIHLGLLMIVSRRHVLTQVAALVGIENGLVVLAASVAGGLPTFMEWGMLVDLLIAATILIGMSRHIHRQFRTADVSALNRLRG